MVICDFSAFFITQPEFFVELTYKNSLKLPLEVFHKVRSDFPNKCRIFSKLIQLLKTNLTTYQTFENKFEEK